MNPGRTKLMATGNVHETFGISIDDCAKLCIDKVGDECKTFGYCYLSMDCIISTNTVAETHPGDLVPDDHCDVYESKRLNYYLFLPLSFLKKFSSFKK